MNINAPGTWGKNQDWSLPPLLLSSPVVFQPAGSSSWVDAALRSYSSVDLEMDRKQSMLIVRLWKSTQGMIINARA